MSIGDNDMNLKHLVMNTSFDDVMKVISIHYDSEEKEQQRELYEELKIMEATPNIVHFTIYVNAFLCSENDENEETRLTVFDEYDSNLYFDVSAFGENDEYAYSIAATPHKELLGYEISDETRRLFSDASILAHILWEATAYSYEEKK